MEISYKGKHTLTYDNNFTPKSNENSCSHKNLCYTQIHSSVVHKSQELETTQHVNG